MRRLFSFLLTYLFSIIWVAGVVMAAKRLGVADSGTVSYTFK
jgi:hypothetical protein